MVAGIGPQSQSDGIRSQSSASDRVPAIGDKSAYAMATADKNLSPLNTVLRFL